MAISADWKTERDAAVTAARQAGEILLDWAGRFSVRMKGLNDLVTEADQAAQDAIHKSLARQFPGDDFIEEESASHPTPRTGDRCWIIDPLDGTTNYVHGFPFFCVSIGLEVAGQLVVGVIYDPSRRELFTATRGGGAFCNGAAINVSGATELSESLLCVGLPANLTSDQRSFRTALEVGIKSRSLRRMGSAALSLAYVAAGRMDGYWGETLHPWDAAAGAILTQEAGGRVSNFDQSPYNLYTPDIVATNGLIHARLAAELGSQGARAAR